jgi:two-component system response regulator DesR
MIGDGRRGSVRVLLADDDRGFLASIRALVDRQPELTVVAEARDGQEAIDLASEVEPDAAVIDLHMPRVNGVGAVEHLRRTHPHLCLIALTGDESPALHAAARDAGADAVLLKGDLIHGLVDRLATVKRKP